ncbi:uncharacterized protein si:ch211-13c6.2 isoform X1 [Channa argus]|uniref:uncharacterized protein si:ch211-13c6.2 isoform X1 n=3 Tax=Channa argus TaxID=215402 RepID=UPI0029455EDE|nr:hypothetical protein Q8A73_000604 [Channa argus]
MDKLETPYDEEAAFIECTVCDKSIRGETLYKIHLTTPGHIKKEDAIVAAGRAVRKRTMPEFKDILQYLDHLKLDEPIIGLSFLDEMPCNDPQAGPKYFCRLCHLTAILSEMVHHVIGRKHRQKYVELKRPDLVTWDKQSIITQGGKIIRARAEIIERQDGRGRPMPLANKGTEDKLNISKVLPKEKQNRNRSITPRVTQQNVPPLLPELKNYRNEYSHREKYPTGHTPPPLFHSREPDANRDRLRGDTLGRDYMEEELCRDNYRKSDMYRRENMDPSYYEEYQEEYINDPHNFSARSVLEPGGVKKYDTREEIPHAQAQYVEYYTDKALPYRGPYPDNDPLKEFYSEEVRRRRVSSAEYPMQRGYPDNEQRWPLERESVRHDTIIRTSSHRSSEPEVNRGNFPAAVESDQSHDHLFCVIRDYQHERKEPHPEGIMSNAGPGRTGPPTSQRQVEVNRTMSDIPEPFRRFLKGANDDETQGKRKRKSRFSDATAEEVEMTKEMFSDKYGPPNPKFGGHPRPVSVQLRHESHGSQHTESYTESQGSRHTESYQKEGFGSESIFDMLKNIEIENAEEADLLKNQLCNLLKEFKCKKSEKAVQNIQGRAVINNSYSSFKVDPELSPRYHYERTLREDSDFRREGYFKDDHRGRVWKEHEHISAKQSIEHHSLGHGEPRYSTRSQREELFGWSEMPRATRPDELAQYPDRFQEPMHPHDYQPTAEEFFNTHSSAPPLDIERVARMNRESRCSKNLDKITSTLLELVARK